MNWRRVSFPIVALLLPCAALLSTCTDTRYDRLTEEQHGRILEQAIPYTGEINFGSSLVALSPSTQSERVDRDALFNAADDFAGLPRSEGHETVFYTCSACHSLAVVMQQRKTAAQWDETLDWMIRKQGMPPPDPAKRRAILQFLTREYGAATSAAHP